MKTEEKDQIGWIVLAVLALIVSAIVAHWLLFGGVAAWPIM